MRRARLALAVASAWCCASPALAQTQLAPVLPPGSTLPPALPYQAPAYQAPTYQAPYQTPNYQTPAYGAPNNAPPGYTPTPYAPTPYAPTPYAPPAYAPPPAPPPASQGYPAAPGPLPSEQAPSAPSGQAPAPSGTGPTVPPTAATPGNATPGSATQGNATQGNGTQGNATPGAGATPGPAATPGTPQSLPISGSWTQAGTAQLILLDKVSAQATTVTVPVGQSTTFETLTILVKACVVRPPDVPPDAAAFLQITDSAAGQPDFLGWMFHQEPALAMLQSPLYNVTVAGCH